LGWLRARAAAGGRLSLGQIEKARYFGDSKLGYQCLVEKVGGNQVRVLSFMSNVWIQNDVKRSKMVDQKISVE
jgi:hypothetical protein